ncbi:MAG: glucose-1-phosphate adenylyltransferase subunit GlgD, partial [Clostridia bacterium]|nr:glucose-1-phosphate adenylyltransferase subunit GlgD [Clostridia bacterium]
ERPIYTNVHNTAPVKYGEHASVSGSMIADGCVIDGTVENCVLFRGVHVGAGSVIRNSVLLGNVYVGKNCDINCTVSEKDALITDGTRLSGCTELPFFIPKGKHI